MLDGVGDRLGYDEIGDGRHGGVGFTSEAVVEADGHRGTLRDGFQSGPEPGLVQHGRIDAPGDFAQFGQRLAALLVGLSQQFDRAGFVLGAQRAAEQHAQGHQSLLDPVVQIALDTAAFVVDRRDDPGPAGGQFRDPPLQLLLVRGAEEVSRQPGFQGRHAEDRLQAEEEQEHGAHTCLRDVHRVLDGGEHPRRRRPQDDGRPRERGDHDATAQ
ncbi:hypothetical protein DF18_12825 [Streptomyces rimosus]|nr:hypothetical protein DF18_12825 [Streptomyces rimosus]